MIASGMVNTRRMDEFPLPLWAGIRGRGADEPHSPLPLTPSHKGRGNP
jgi:hypothetical protein